MEGATTSFLDPVFNPLLGMPPFWAVFTITAIITLVITIIYKYTTDQKKMKALKDDLKKMQKKMTELAKTDPQKAMKMQKEAMSKNMEMMKHSFRPTLYTFIPIIIIFGWLNAHMAYYELDPGQQFNITLQFAEEATGQVAIDVVPELEILGPTAKEITNDKVSWTLKGEAGDYMAGFKYGEETFKKEILISEQRFYAPPQSIIKDSKLKSITLSNKPIHPFGEWFSLFGWKPGWLGAYIILSLILSLIFRKIFNVV
jgi:uncharacterized membrane protein (DUF106 family)